MNIEFFKVNKLNGYNNYSLPIKNNKFVLVGENGTGKSTVLAMLYFFLSCKWKKLNAYQFESVSLTLNGDEHLISKIELETYLDANRDRVSRPKGRLIEVLKTFIKDELEKKGLNNGKLHELPIEYVSKLCSELRFSFSKNTGNALPPVNVVRNLVYDLIDFNEVYINDCTKSNIKSIEAIISESIKSSVLYLPTYRRIEQNFEQIFSNSVEDIDDIVDENSDNEFAKFGMKDVERLINAAMQELSSNFRNKLKDLIASSLQDILGHKYENDAEEKISNIGEKDLEEILARVDSETLSTQVKEEIRKNTRKYGRKKTTPDTNADEITIYFIRKLIQLHRLQSDKEKYINSFVDVCNKYLVNKEIYFDRIKFDVYVILKSEKISLESRKIKWETLSSGEKQIISLFSKIHLEKKNDFIMIIDEPELSLSLDWQCSFLDDIVKNNFCKGMFAVTHSPFIYQNSLKDYARSIGEIMEGE
ncbi:hypothetical protein XK97_06080 [Obesumbacterium proteus]|uniref:AAA family ATPase n=1 Tax=Obesumbacterium proteus TaxID=82983 RepID=UPI000621771C|nr:AAA family ATPase [Obesumbacterium proteus]KKI47944.1 hypothetical protein XK97_06080 [Obesumbacterium proteus]